MADARDISGWKRRARRLVLCTVLLASALCRTAEAAAAERIVFGVVPHDSASRLAESWLPLIERLKRETGLDIEFAATATIPIVEACLKAGAFGVAYMNPYQYVVVSESGRYRPLVRNSELLQGIVVAASDSPIADMRGLDGLEVAFPAPAAFGASVLPRAEIEAANVTITPHYVRSHDSVYRAVANGLMPAGGGAMNTWRNQPDEILKKLKIIYITTGYTAHAIAASSAIETRTAEKIAEALLSLDDTSAALLLPIGVQRFQRARDSDWDDVRKLKISKTRSGFEDRAQLCPFD